MGAMIHTSVVDRYTPSTHSFWTSPGCVHPEISSSQNFFVSLIVRPGLFPHALLFFVSNYQLAPLTNATPAL